MSDAPTPATPQPGPAAIESLLAHRNWVRALARSLVRDDSTADDVEQQTWQAALENPPDKLSAARAWLGSVVRRTVLDSQRRHVRRERREKASARPEGQPSASDVVARVEIDRAVVNSVAELPEPYKTTLLLRFYDGLPPRDVAKRMDVPVETVRARIRRGLERVRVGLDGRHGGDREKWKAALIPFLAGPGGLDAPDTPDGDTPDGDVPDHIDAPQPSGASSAASSATVPMTVIIATVGALTLGVVGGVQLQGSDDAVDDRSAELAEAAAALEDERNALTELRERLAGLRADGDARAEQIAELQLAASALFENTATVAGPEIASEPDTPFERPFLFPDYESALAGVDWDELGELLASLVPVIEEVYDYKVDGADLRPEAAGLLQVHNGALVTILGPLDDSFPGGGVDDALTHPAFAATMTAAVCHARDVPLTAEQLTAIDRLAHDASDAVARIVDGTADREFRLEALIDETEVKLEFASAVRGLLDPEQRVLLGNETLRNLMGFDLFGPAQMWTGAVEAGSFAPDFDFDIGSRIASGLTHELGLDAHHEDQMTAVVSAWIDALPADFIDREPGPLGDLDQAQQLEVVLAGADHMIDLMRRVSALDLTAAQREAVRDTHQVLLLRRARP